MLVDLSHPIVSGMPVYPGDAPVEIRQTRFLAENGFNNHLTTFGQHIGTHVDGPMHMSDHPLFIGQFPLERFSGPACVLDVRGCSVMDVEDVDLSGLAPGGIALFCTGWDVHFGSDTYFKDHPVLTEALAKALVERGVKLVGMDIPSPDRAPFSVHKRLFAAEVMLVENLRGLAPLVGLSGIRFHGFPLALRTDASPIRAVAEVL